VKGRLVIDRAEGEWRASIAGRSSAVRISNDTVSFVLSAGDGSFVGRFSARRSTIVGHWIQPRTVTDGNTFASPVVLSGCGTSRFTGSVAPRDEEFTFYIKVAKRPDGTLGAFIRNPQRNLGRSLRTGVDTGERGAGERSAAGEVVASAEVGAGVMRKAQMADRGLRTANS